MCVYFNYPQLSASYLEAEIRYFLTQGFDVQVWSETAPGSPYTASVYVHHGSLEDAEKEFCPDIIHFYWVKMAANYLPVVKCKFITARSHSFEVEINYLAALQNDYRVKAIFVFPHQFAEANSKEKLVPLSVAYDTNRFPRVRNINKQRDSIICCTAGLPAKSLEVFFDVACLCRELKFTLMVATCTGHEDLIEQYINLNQKLGNPVTLLADVPHREVVPALQNAGIYLCTQKAAKKGMPIAIAEALACGCYILVPELPWLGNMISEHGSVYESTDHVLELIRSVQEFPDNYWASISDRASDYAEKSFSDQAVLPKVLEIWAELY
ncbi:MAG: glycosyltransferase [Syntrophales bacterium]